MRGPAARRPASAAGRPASALLQEAKKVIYGKKKREQKHKHIDGDGDVRGGTGRVFHHYSFRWHFEPFVREANSIIPQGVTFLFF